MYPVFKKYLHHTTTLAGAGLALAALLAFAARAHWRVELLCHFRVQYVAGLLVCAVLASLLRRWRFAGVWVVLALVNAVPVLPFYRSAGDPVVPDTRAVSCIALNVNTYHGDSKAVAEYLSAESADLLLLQEVSAQWLTSLSAALAIYPYRLEAPRDDNFGIALYSRFALSNLNVVASPVLGVPAIQGRLALDAGDVAILGVHTVPPKSKGHAQARNRHFAQIANLVDASQPTLVMGDLNATPWSPHFRDLITHSGLRDSMKGFGVQPSWHTMALWVRIPIDHALVSEHITVRKRRIGPHVGSDHFPLAFEIALKPLP